MRVLSVDRDVLYLDKGALHATALLPASPAAPLLLSSALLSHSNISNSHIHDAHSVVTSLLTVREQAEFLADVVIDGSVTVHGTVIGSGPYVDSSDARFKKNITTLSGALDTVNKLRGVSSISSVDIFAYAFFRFYFCLHLPKSGNTNDLTCLLFQK